MQLLAQSAWIEIAVAQPLPRQKSTVSHAGLMSRASRLFPSVTSSRKKTTDAKKPPAREPRVASGQLLLAGSARGLAVGFAF
jgi:hypothetical protein